MYVCIKHTDVLFSFSVIFLFFYQTVEGSVVEQQNQLQPFQQQPAGLCSALPAVRRSAWQRCQAREPPAERQTVPEGGKTNKPLNTFTSAKAPNSYLLCWDLQSS